MDLSQIPQQLVNGLSMGALYALIAVGYTVVYGIVQLINFAHGEVFMIGAFSAVSVHIWFFNGETGIWVLPFMILGAVVASVLIALAMERIAYRPLRGASRLAPLITAIGVSVALQEAARLFYGEIPGMPSGKQKVTYPDIDIVTGVAVNIGGVDVPRPALFTIGCLIVCSIFLWWFIAKTKTGRAMRAVASDPDTAKLMGINVDRIIMVAFAVGAALAGIAGVAQGLQTTNANARMGFMAGLKAFTAAVLGGIGNVQGAVAGGLVLGVAEAFATGLVPNGAGSAWKDIFAFSLLIIILVFRPQGLLGSKAVDRA